MKYTLLINCLLPLKHFHCPSHLCAEKSLLQIFSEKCSREWKQHFRTSESAPPPVGAADSLQDYGVSADIYGEMGDIKK